MLPPRGISGAPRRWKGPNTVEFGRALGLSVTDQVDHHRHPERIREQDELLPLVAAHLASFGQDLDRLEPFRLGQLDLFDEFVQMADEASMIRRSRGSGVSANRASTYAVMSSSVVLRRIFS